MSDDLIPRMRATATFVAKDTRALLLAAADALEKHNRPQEALMLGLHRCKVCHTRWLLWPDGIHGGGWNLLDQRQRPGACCDNVAMGEQIEHLRDLPLTLPARVTPGEPPPWQELAGLVEEFIGWWHLNRDRANRAYDYIDKLVKRLDAVPIPSPPASAPQQEETKNDQSRVDWK